MYLHRLARHISRGRIACNPPSVRMASTFVGESGRVYVQGEELQRHRQDQKLSIFKAAFGNESFVFKRVSRSFFDRSLRLAADFACSRRLRMHIDCNREEGILVYPFYKDTLLALIEQDPDLSVTERVKILRCVGEAIQELHHKNWIHIDVKPDNILVNWTCDEEGHTVVTNAALGDFDIAFRLEGGREQLETPYAIGNAMWRSPEGQTGRGVTKASDVYSFGLVCLYALGAGELLLLENYQELVKLGVSPEQEILTRHFCYFGPVPEELFRLINDREWCEALRGSSAMAEEQVKEHPEKRFRQWGKDLGPESLDMIGGMTNLDPRARITMDQVLTHQFWQET